MDSIYECPACEQQYDHQISVAETNNTDEVQIRDAQGRMHKSRTRSSDYRTIQIQTNRAHLILLNDAWATMTGRPKIHDEVLDEAAKMYSNIQMQYYNLRGKKFVRRGNIKDQILAFLVYRILKRKRIGIQRADIAKIFELDITGFSTGETQVNELNKALDLDLVHNTKEEIMDLSLRYLAALDLASENPGQIYTQKNLQLVVDIIVRAEVIKCGMHCYLYSRVAGAVFMLTNELGIKFRNKIIEAACDSCKKNTFDRFRKIVQKNGKYFADIFDNFHNGTGSEPEKADVIRLPHMIKYLQLLIIDHPQIDEFKQFLELCMGPDVADDLDFNIDALLKKYDLF